MKKFYGPLLLVFLTACSTPGETGRLTLTYVGNYLALTDAQDPLSCYCPTGGYLTTCGNYRIPVCFTETAPEDNCGLIEATGYYLIKTRPTVPGRNCPEEEFRYFVIEEWECR